MITSKIPKTETQNYKELFRASDITRALVYSNPRDTVERHCKGVVKRDGVTNYIGYSNMQTLITPKGRETFRLLCI